MFSNMGLLGLFHMAELSHKAESIQFLATLNFYDDTALDFNDENRGRISFKINGKAYGMTMVQLGLLYNFAAGGEVSALAMDVNELQGVWTLIGGGHYKQGLSKATIIRHPAIRYAHKLLAHTLFARRETGAVKEEELALLIEGIKPYLRTTATGNAIVGQPQRINFARFLVHRFLYYQDWATTNKDKTPQLGIGGLITPILRACGVELQMMDDTVSIARIDAAYLSTSQFLVGQNKNRYGYRFHLGTEKRVILLPHISATYFMERENILFNPRLWLLYDANRDGPFSSLRITRHGPQPQEEERVPEEIYGSKRYDFAPYADPIAGTALKAAHEHISLLQRLTKWQNKQIKKLVKTVKKQGKAIKRILKDTSSPTRRTEEEAEPSSQRRKKGKAPLSPSSSGSGNLSYSMESSSPSPSR